VIFVSASFGDPIRRPAEILFRTFFIAAAGLCGAFTWGLLYGKPVEPSGPASLPDDSKNPTNSPMRRTVKRTRLGTRRFLDGSVETVYEKHEEEENT